MGIVSIVHSVILWIRGRPKGQGWDYQAQTPNADPTSVHDDLEKKRNDVAMEVGYLLGNSHVV